MIRERASHTAGLSEARLVAELATDPDQIVAEVRQRRCRSAAQLNGFPAGVANHV